MNLSNGVGNLTKQMYMFLREVSKQLQSKSSFMPGLLPTKEGTKPLWIQTWSLLDTQDNLSFLNILRTATNTASSENIYMISRLKRDEYKDFASKMGWSYVTEVNEIAFNSTNLQIIFVGFPTILKKQEDFLSLPKENLIIITEFKWER
jgi:hypothetical protein